MNTQESNAVKLKAYSPGELARLYDVNIRTFKRWIVPFEDIIGKRQGRYYNIRQVKIIFGKLSLPRIIILE